MKLLSRFRVYLCLLGTIPIAACNTTTVRNADNLPALRQQVIDLEAVYRGRATNIVIPQSNPPRSFNYEELDGNSDVAFGDVLDANGRPQCWTAFGFKINPDTNQQQLGDHQAPPGNPRPFKGLPSGPGNQRDWEYIIQGKYHCSPTVATMILIYWAKEHGKQNLMQGITDDAAGHVEMIKRLAEVLDTNDQNPSKNSNDHLGHIGTFGTDQIAGIREYAQANGGYNLRVEMRDFSMAVYKREIDAHRPVIIHFGNPGKKVGHVVVGYGYRGNTVLYKNPWDGSLEEKAANQIRQIRTVQEGMGKLYGIVPLPLDPAFASEPWVDVFMVTVQEAVTP